MSDLSRQSDNIANQLRIHKITSIRKQEISDLIVLSFRREAALKADTIKLLAGTPEEFIDYITSHPLRYRLIGDPGKGKTPTTAVMISEILKVGGTRGNTAKGRKIPNTLVAVSYPGAASSQKDDDYPLEFFLKYGDKTSAVKSFSDAEDDWTYRCRDTKYAENFFQLWVWDEFDNTVRNADNPNDTGAKFLNFLKQAHHTGVGWIVSGQSVMTKTIPGFMDDDRELFTQIIIDSEKIRKYLEKYGKKIMNEKVVGKLLKNIEELEPYLEEKNSLVTDDARLLRLALILDDRSPKLYFLPNLDLVKYDYEKIENVITESAQMKTQFLTQTTGQILDNKRQNDHTVSNPVLDTHPPIPTIGGSAQSAQNTQKPYCPHCSGSDLILVENQTRYQCSKCKTAAGRAKKIALNKVVWK